MSEEKKSEKPKGKSLRDYLDSDTVDLSKSKPNSLQHKDLSDGFVRGSLIGEGGMARVFEAKDTRLNRTVALKILRPELCDDEEHFKRFRHEATLLSQLDHPGALPVYTQGISTKWGPYIAMKRVSGTTLRRMIKRVHQFRYPAKDEIVRLVEIFEKVCLTVAYAHDHGIVHRDIKPDNVMVDDYGVVLLLDWGMAKAIKETNIESDMPVTRSGIIKGTPYYMSPEQANGDELDFRSDVFSLGVILYEILAGRFPFDGNDIRKVLQLVISSTPPSPSQVNYTADKVLSAICMKALTKDPARRYAQAGELVEDIRLWRNNMPTSAYTPDMFENILAWIKRNRAISATIATSLVACVILFMVWFHNFQTERIKEAEEGKRIKLQEQLSRQAESEKEKQIKDEIRREMDMINLYNREINLLNHEKKLISSEEEAKIKNIEIEINEIATAMEFSEESVRISYRLLLDKLIRKSGNSNIDTESEAYSFVRKLTLDDIIKNINLRKFYKAHYLLWLYTSGKGSLVWTKKESEILNRLKVKVDEELQKELGKNTPLPDWKEYQSSPALYSNKHKHSLSGQDK